MYDVLFIFYNCFVDLFVVSTCFVVIIAMYCCFLNVCRTICSCDLEKKLYVYVHIPGCGVFVKHTRPAALRGYVPNQTMSRLNFTSMNTSSADY